MGRPATLKVDIVADAKGVGKGVDDATSKLGKLGGIAGGIGKGLAFGLAGGAAALVGFAGASVGAASDIQQSFGALESVYGKNAVAVKKWAADAAVAVGLSKNEYANLAAVVGAQLQGMGLSQAASAKQSRDLIKVGADLSATFGGSVSDAVSAVSSLLKGESDPIERYGVSIKASDVNARLAAQGLGKLTGQALKQAQAQATLSLLMDKTKTSVGAFGRESDTLAHKQQVLGAKLENVKATVGAALLPVLAALAGFVSDQLLPALGRLGPVFDSIGKFITTTALPAFAQFQAFINAKVIPAARSFASTVGSAVLPIVKTLATFFFGTLLPAFRAVIGFILGTVVPGLAKTLKPILAGISSLFASVTNKISDNKDSFITLWNAIKPVIGFLVDKVAPVIGKVIGTAFGLMGKAIGLVIDSIAALIRLIDKAVQKVKDLAKTIKNNPISKGIGGIAHGVTSGFGLLDLRSGPVSSGRAPTNITINAGAGADPVAIARAMERVLTGQAVRSGRVPTFSPAR